MLSVMRSKISELGHVVVEMKVEQICELVGPREALLFTLDHCIVQDKSIVVKSWCCGVPIKKLVNVNNTL